MQGNELVNTRLSKKVKLVFSILRVVLKSSLSGDLEFADLLKVKSFLDSIGRNSIKSKTSYLLVLDIYIILQLVNIQSIIVSLFLNH